MLKFLLDTHTLLWTLYEPDRLPLRVRDSIEEPSNLIFVSHVSLWEIVDKAAKFRLPIAGSSVDQIVARIDELQTIVVPIQLEDVVASVKLPQVHGDPMDRVLIAQAQRLNATLISKDGKFAQYDVSLLWK